jgi:hypothetical protein
VTKREARALRARRKSEGKTGKENQEAFKKRKNGGLTPHQD